MENRHVHVELEKRVLWATFRFSRQRTIHFLCRLIQIVPHLQPLLQAASHLRPSSTVDATEIKLFLVQSKLFLVGGCRCTLLMGHNDRKMH